MALHYCRKEGEISDARARLESVEDAVREIKEAVKEIARCSSELAAGEQRFRSIEYRLGCIETDEQRSHNLLHETLRDVEKRLLKVEGLSGMVKNVGRWIKWIVVPMLATTASWAALRLAQVIIHWKMP